MAAVYLSGFLLVKWALGLTVSLEEYPLAVIVTGPTASGKSALSIAIARQLSGCVANLDSVQVYRGFDIGSAKPSAEERRSVPHILFDIAQADEDMDAAKYAGLAKAAWKNSKIPPVFTGGTGLYLRSLLSEQFHVQETSDAGYRLELEQKLTELGSSYLHAELTKVDPERAKALHANDHVRIVRALEILHCTGMPFAEFTASKSHADLDLRSRCFWVHLSPDKELLRERIRERTRTLLKDSALQNEVLGLLRVGVSAHVKPMRTIGYKQVVEVLRGELDASELEDRIFYATCQYAKRQRTWFAKTKPDLCFESLGAEVNQCQLMQEVRKFA